MTKWKILIGSRSHDSTNFDIARAMVELRLHRQHETLSRASVTSAPEVIPLIIAGLKVLCVRINSHVVPSYPTL